MKRTLTKEDIEAIFALADQNSSRFRIKLPKILHLGREKYMVTPGTFSWEEEK